MTQILPLTNAPIYVCQQENAWSKRQINVLKVTLNVFKFTINLLAPGVPWKLQVCLSMYDLLLDTRPYRVKDARMTSDRVLFKYSLRPASMLKQDSLTFCFSPWLLAFEKLSILMLCCCLKMYSPLVDYRPNRFVFPIR